MSKAARKLEIYRRRLLLLLGLLDFFLGAFIFSHGESSLMGDYNRLVRASIAAPKIPSKLSAAPA